MDKTCAGPCGLPLKKNFGRGLCWKCYADARKDGELDLYAKLPQPSAIDGTKQHRLSNKNPNDMTADCLVCGPGVSMVYKKKKNEYRCRNKAYEHTRNYESKKPYIYKRNPPVGVDLQHFRETVPVLEKKQQGLCAICTKPFGENPYMVDHDHETGLIRGLLCFNCNTGLGRFGDNLEGLLAAVRYLEAHNTL